MIRMRIQISEEQSRYLKKLALEKNASVAELIRSAIDLLKSGDRQPDWEEKKNRVLAAVGRFRKALLPRHANLSTAQICLGSISEADALHYMGHTLHGK